MTVSITDLRRLVPELLTQAGTTLDQVAVDIFTAHDTYGCEVLAPLASGTGWTGANQPLATAEVGRTHHDLCELGEVLRAGARAVSVWAGHLEEQAGRLRQAELVAFRHGLVISDDGAIVSQAGELADGTHAVLQELNARVSTILAEATTCDDRARQS